jgi:hypothetical protein
MDVIAYAVMALSALGLGLSLFSHVCALAGIDGPLGDMTWGLHIGIFVVWLPAVLFSRTLGRNASQHDFWKVILRGCPPWMRYAFYGLFAYAFVNFAAFILMPNRATQGSGGSTPPSVVRGFSGHWMLFYAAAFVVAYSYARVRSQRDPRCPNGHQVSPLAKFCEQCGAAVIGPARFGGTPLGRT